jgi:hypothetical protein
MSCGSFLGPTFKWCLNVANVAEFVKPPEEISYPQQLGTVTLQMIHFDPHFNVPLLILF